MLALLGAGGYFAVSWYSARHANYTGQGYGQVVVQVNSGDIPATLAPELVRLGVIAATQPFIDIAKQDAGILHPGKFRLRHHMNATDAWKLLLSGKSLITTPTSFFLGGRTSDVVTELAKDYGVPAQEVQADLNNTKALGLPAYAGNHAVGPDYPLAEGYLYPGYYSFKHGTTPLQMLQAMVSRFKTETAGLNLAAAARQGGFNNEVQVITEASILMAEVGSQTQYYPDVARVIDNRLNVPMALNLDSTIEYGLGIHGFSMTETQLHKNTPYNTNLHDGLPPGPIESPDIEAIKAVLHPASKANNWLYFVTINKAGLTKFTHSPSQFLVWSNEAKKNGI